MQKGSRLGLAWAVNVAKAKTQLKDARIVYNEMFCVVDLGREPWWWDAHFKNQNRGLPGGPGVKTLPTKAGSVPLVPGWLTRSHMLHSMAKRFKKKKKKQYLDSMLS